MKTGSFLWTSMWTTKTGLQKSQHSTYAEGFLLLRRHVLGRFAIVYLWVGPSTVRTSPTVTMNRRTTVLALQVATSDLNRPAPYARNWMNVSLSHPQQIVIYFLLYAYIHKSLPKITHPFLTHENKYNHRFKYLLIAWISEVNQNSHTPHREKDHAI